MWLCIALFPILEVYFFIPGISLGIFSLLLLLPMCLYSYPLQFFKSKALLIYFLSVLLINTVSFVLNDSGFVSFNLFWHNMIWILIFFFLLGYYTSVRPTAIYLNGSVVIAIIATVILLFQFILYLKNGVVPNFFLLSKLRDRSFEVLSRSRPYSLFLAP